MNDSNDPLSTLILALQLEGNHVQVFITKSAPKKWLDLAALGLSFGAVDVALILSLSGITNDPEFVPFPNNCRSEVTTEKISSTRVFPSCSQQVSIISSNFVSKKLRFRYLMGQRNHMSHSGSQPALTAIWPSVFEFSSHHMMGSLRKLLVLFDRDSIMAATQ